jgi:hypothetical protein
MAIRELPKNAVFGNCPFALLDSQISSDTLDKRITLSRVIQTKAAGKGKISGPGAGGAGV